ncbi:MAG: DUF5317 domain-containing protein [Mycobacterium leprae]
MLFLEVSVLSFLIAFLRGGRLKPDPELRQMWVAPVSFVLQEVNYFWVPSYLNVPVTVIAYGLLFYFAWVNMENQGVRFILIGMLLNAVVIMSNGGRIPVDLSVASRIGVDVEQLVHGVAAKHAALTSASHLKFLGDVIPVRYPVPRIISVGDIFAFIGTFLLVQDLMGKRITIRPEEQR